jgi:hypothetical protein
MTVDEEALRRIEALIEKARALRDGDFAGSRGVTAQVKTAVATIAGPTSDYYRDIVEANVRSTRVDSEGRAYVAILSALREDVESGYLRRAEDLIAAEVFGSFLDMAEHLIDAGYYHPAASLTGAVLEDGLRRLAAKSELDVRPDDDLSSLNNRLASKGAYNNLVRKQVDTWAATRNLADHGQFEQVSVGDVREMHTGVSRFLGERLG